VSRAVWLATATALVAIGSAAAASPTPHVATASLDGWTARLSYTLAGTGYQRQVGSMRLRVSHGGAVVLDRALPLPKDCRGYPCAPFPGGSAFFEVRDLGLSSGPVGIVWLWTGGAHCCSVVRFVALADGGSVSRNFGDPGAVVETLDGERVIRSADDRFAYLFASYAASGLPLQVWRFTGAALIDVTREHPGAVRADAAGWWRAYREQRGSKQGETRGVFAAWAADVCLLGQRAKVEHAIADGLARGDFSGDAASDMLPPHGAAYAKQLRQRLGSWGYCTA
jgi:hypothetical protein